MKIQAGKEKVTIIPATVTRNTPGKSATQKLRVAAYCRVSTDSEEQINSYKNPRPGKWQASTLTRVSPAPA